MLQKISRVMKTEQRNNSVGFDEKQSYTRGNHSKNKKLISTLFVRLYWTWKVSKSFKGNFNHPFVRMFCSVNYTVIHTLLCCIYLNWRCYSQIEESFHFFSITQRFFPPNHFKPCVLMHSNLLKTAERPLWAAKSLTPASSSSAFNE